MDYKFFFSNLDNVLFKKKKKNKVRFIIFLYVLKISNSIYLVEKLKKLEKEYTTARPTYHRFNYNRLRVKQATSTSEHVSMEYTTQREEVMLPILTFVLFSETRMPRGTSNRYNYSIFFFLFRALFQGCMVLHG